MGYCLNPKELSSFFAVPCSVVDKYLTLASATNIKVLLWMLRNSNTEFDTAKAAEALNIPEYDVRDALKYWEDKEILYNPDNALKNTNSVQGTDKLHIAARAQTVKPSREEVARRGNECPEIALILREAELKFGRSLRQNEASTLVWLYDDEGLSVAILLMLIQFAASQGKAYIGFIEKTAIEWINDGITNIHEAEKRLQEIHAKKTAWGIVRSVMGIEHHSPSKKELNSSYKWIEEWKYPRDLLRLAYERCIDQNSKFSFAYTASILENWHKAGVNSVEQAEKLNAAPSDKQKSNSSSGHATYNLSAAEKMMLSD